MSDVNAIINIDINSTSALTNLKRLESQIDQFNRSIATSNATAAASQQSLNRALLDGINNTGLFTAKITPVESSMIRFSRSLDEGRLSLGEYTKYASSQLPGLSRVFKREFDSIEQVATSRVKSMQTQYLALGKTVDGVTRTIASTPTGLGKGLATDLAMVQQRQQIFNKLLDDGSTKLLNWGKNTQWAGRQLMVGFTLPLAAFGAAASKTFMEIDKATISLKRVYGDLNTTKAELDSNVQAIKGLGKEYTKYGITLAQTIELSGRAAATGATNEKLMAATEQTLRFATLGQMDYNQALDTTISLQTAFAISNEDLGKTVDYLNAVENQTILTMEDMSLAIPRVATVVKGLGGSVQDLAVMMTAMREGGVSAENAANGLKSGLASLINPTDRASEGLAKMGINLNSIIKQNKGDLMGIITEFGTAINKLDEFSRQQVLEQVFGKYQYARMSALFTNITKDAGQAARAMDIAGMSAADLAKVSEKELGQISESTSVKFQAAMEQLKISIAPIGEAFLKGITPIVNMVSKIADAFNNLPDGVKNTIAVVTGLVAGLGPVFLMTIGLLGNGLANLVKGFQFFRKMIAGIKGDASAFTWLAQGELEAVTASKALEGSATNLTDKLLLQRGAVAGLTAEYERFAVVAGLAGARMGGMGGGTATRGAASKRTLPSPRGFATGGIVPGTGSGDTIPALLTPGESVITKKATQKYAPILQQMNDGTLPGFAFGTIAEGMQSAIFKKTGRQMVSRSGKIPNLPAAALTSTGSGLSWQSQGPMLARESEALGRPTTRGGKKEDWKDVQRGHVVSAIRNGKDQYNPGIMLWQRGSINQRLKSDSKNPVTAQELIDDFESLDVHPASMLSSAMIGLGVDATEARTYAKKAYEDMVKRLAKETKRKPPTLFGGSEKSFEDFAEQSFRSILPTEIFDSLYSLGTYRAGGGRSKKAILRPVELSGGRVSIGQALKSWQTSSRVVREDPEMLGALMSGMRPSQSAKTLTRGTTLGLSRGSEFDPTDERMIMDALRSGNVDSLIGRTFPMRGPISYTAGNSDSAINAMRQNSDVNRIEELKRQHTQAKIKHKADLEKIKQLKEKIALGTAGPATMRRYEAQLAELEGFVSMYAAGQKRRGKEIKSLTSRGYEDLLIEQSFPSGSSMIDVNEINPSGTFMGKDVSRENEFLSGGSMVRIKGVKVDSKTGLQTLELETISDNIQRRALGGPIVPGSGNNDTVPAMLTPGEFVINKQATQANLPLLHAINNGKIVNKNKGGMIDGIQYFAEGGEAQSDRGSASGSGAYKAETRRIMAVGWDSLQTEKLILEAMRDNNKITQSQFDAFSQGETSHITPEVGPNGGKMWRPSNMMADLGLINNYIEAQKGTSKKALGNAKLFGEIQSKTSLSAERLRAELDLLSRGFHATTRESAMALRALSQVGDQTAQKIAVNKVLEARLQGTFYDTLNAPERQYRSDLPVEEKFGKRGKGGNRGRNIPQPETRDPMRPPKVSSQEADRIRRQARTEAERSLIAERGVPFIQNSDYEKEIEKRAKDIRTREYKRISKEHGREQARLIAISRQSEMQQPTPELDMNVPNSEEERNLRRQARRQKIGKGLKGAGGAVGMLSMLPFMMQNEEGKFMGMDANMLGTGMMVGGMAMPAMGSAVSAAGGAGMLAGGGIIATLGTVLAPLAAAAAIAGVGLMIWRKNIDNTSKETAKLASNVGVTANSLGEISKILGVSTPSQRQAQMNLGITKEDIQNQEIISPILQSEGGQKFIEELKTATSEERFKKLADYTKAAIASGMMDKSTASTFAKGVSLSLNDVLLGRRMMPVISGQKIGSGGMMSIADERISALNKSSEIKRVAAASGESRTITTADAAYTVGATTQVISDLSNVIALAREEYDKGTISFEKMRSTVDKATASQNEYSSMLTKAISGSMEQGGTRQALNDALVTMGVDPEKLSTFKNAMDIGVGGPGVSAFQQEQTKRILTEKGMSGNIVTNPNAIGSSRSAAYGARFSNLTGSAKSFENYQAAKEQAARDESAIVNAQTSGLAEQLLQAVAANKITIDQANVISEQVRTGSKFGMDLVREFNAGAKDLGGTLNALFVASSRTADIAGVSDAKVMGISQKDRYISAGAAFGRKGGDVEQYAALIESIPSQKRIDIITTFNGLTYEQQSKEIADMTQLSAAGGSENAGKLQSSDFYQKELKKGKTKAIIDRSVGAANAGVGEDYLSIMATITAEDNGEPISSKEYYSRSKIVLKALKDFSSNDKVKKQKAGIILMQQIEDPDGKKISAKDAEKGMQDLMKRFGKGKTLNLPRTVFKKVLILESKVIGLQKMIDAEKTILSTLDAGSQKAQDLRLAIRLQENAQVALYDQIQSEYDQSGVSGGGGGGKGGGGGTNPLLDFKKSLLEQIKLYADIEATLKTLFSAKNSILGILSKNNGIDDKLRAAGLGETMVQSIMGMGADAAKKWIGKNISGGKLNAAGKQEQTIARANVLGAAGSQAEGAINTAKAQQQASAYLITGKYGKGKKQTLGQASGQVLSMIAGSPELSDAYVAAVNEVIAADKKYRSSTGEAKVKAKNEWDAKRESLEKYLKRLDESITQQTVAGKLTEARATIKEDAAKNFAKNRLAKDSSISKELRDAISGDGASSLAYIQLGNAVTRSQAALAKTKKGSRGYAKKKQQAEFAQSAFSDFMKGQELGLGDPEQRRLQANLDLANKAKEESDKLYKAQTDPLIEQINLINRQIEAIQKLNDADQNRIRNLNREKEMLERDIEAINRKNEKDQVSIEKLQREDELRNRVADALNHELSLMSNQETKIREAYDKRVKALDEVAKINDYIIGQQKSQLGLAQALSQGDVYAAAAAQQEMQTGTAQFAQNQMRAGLQTGMENQVAGLTTSGGLTRVQAEDQIRAIGEQSYQTSLLVRDLQDVIYARNLDIAAIKETIRGKDDDIRRIQDDIYKRETNIIGLQTGKLTDLNNQLTAINDQKDAVDKVANANIDAAQVALDNYGLTQEQIDQVYNLALQWREVVKQIDNANKAMKDQLKDLIEPTKPDDTASAKVKAQYETDYAEWKTKYDKIIADNAAAKKTAMDSGKPLSTVIAKAAGGIIGTGGRDSIPAMLTPGEFVMRKASVEKYGASMFEKMNMGAFEMPRYNMQQPSTTAIQPVSNNSNINAPVYNSYSVNVHANTNANADDIANTVMTKIKRVDSMAVRSFRGY